MSQRISYISYRHGLPAQSAQDKFHLWIWRLVSWLWAWAEARPSAVFLFRSVKATRFAQLINSATSPNIGNRSAYYWAQTARPQNSTEPRYSVSRASSGVPEPCLFLLVSGHLTVWPSAWRTSSKSNMVIEGGANSPTVCSLKAKADSDITWPWKINGNGLARPTEHVCWLAYAQIPIGPHSTARSLWLCPDSLILVSVSHITASGCS